WILSTIIAKRSGVMGYLVGLCLSILAFAFVGATTYRIEGEMDFGRNTVYTTRYVNVVRVGQAKSVINQLNTVYETRAAEERLLRTTFGEVRQLNNSIQKNPELAKLWPAEQFVSESQIGAWRKETSIHRLEELQAVVNGKQAGINDQVRAVVMAWELQKIGRAHV